MALGGRLRPRLLSLQLQECIGDIYSSACSSAASSPALAARNWGLKFGSRDRKEEKTRWVKYQRCGLACCACVLSRVRLFWDPMEYSPPGSSVHRISQARILEWLSILFFRGFSWPRDQTQGPCIAGRFLRASLVPQRLKRLSPMWETREDPLEKEMATHSRILAWGIPWTEEPGRLRSTGSQSVGHAFSLFTIWATREAQEHS